MHTVPGPADQRRLHRSARPRSDPDRIRPWSGSSATRSTASSGDARRCGSTSAARSPPRSRAPAASASRRCARISSRRWSASCSARRAIASPISKPSRSRVPLLKSGTYAMAGATIVDGTGRPPIPDGVDRRARRADRRGRSARGRSTIPAGVPSVAVDGKTIVPGPVGHAHARHADRVGAGLSGGRRDDGPRHGERVRVHRRRCATRSRRGAPLGPRIARRRA